MRQKRDYSKRAIINDALIQQSAYTGSNAVFTGEVAGAMSGIKSDIAMLILDAYKGGRRKDPDRDLSIYFDGIGAELYLQYDVDESVRIAGGGNWLFPEDDDYEGKFSINNVILSLQYTFGEKTFDDLVYVEVSMPNGKLANGESKDTRFAIGIRYLLDY